MQALSDAEAWVTLLKDIVTIIALIVSAIVAVPGINAWKEQITGKAEYELAHRLLRSVYQVRDAIRNVGTPILTSGEIAHALK